MAKKESKKEKDGYDAPKRRGRPRREYSPGSDKNERVAAFIEESGKKRDISAYEAAVNKERSREIKKKESGDNVVGQLSRDVDSGSERVSSTMREEGDAGEANKEILSNSEIGSVDATVIIGDLARPDAFAKYVLGCDQYGWQADVLKEFEKPWCKLALCAANESGKTGNVISPAALWQMLAHPGSVVVVTAKQERQIVHSLMDSLKQFSPRLSTLKPEWKESELIFNFPDGRKSKLIGFTTNEGARFESFHNRKGSQLAIIVDECKEISDDIFVAVDRCNPFRRLYASSPSNNPVGRFHNIITENPEGYWLKFVSAFDCPHISKDRIENAKKAYGVDSAIYRSMILGLPTEENSDCIFSAAAIDVCMGVGAPEFIHGSHVAFVDWSTGGDEIVVAIRKGNRVEIPLAFTTDRSRHGAATEILSRVEECLIENRMNVGDNKYIFADDDGIGWQFNNLLNERGWNIGLFRGGSRAYKKEHYQNRICEVWYSGADVVKRGGVILPNDKKLRFQLVSRQRRYDTTNPTMNKMQPKSELTSSPDRGDAVLGCMMLGPAIPEKIKQAEAIQYKNEEFDDFLLDNDEDLYIKHKLLGFNIGRY